MKEFFEYTPGSKIRFLPNLIKKDLVVIDHMSLLRTESITSEGRCVIQNTMKMFDLFMKNNKRINRRKNKIDRLYGPD